MPRQRLQAGGRQRERDRCSHHGNGDRPALQMVRDHARRIACRQRPEQTGKHPGKEAGRHRDRVSVGYGCHGIDDGEAGDGKQQERTAAPALCGSGQRYGCDQRTNRVNGNKLPSQRLGNGKACPYLRKQTRRQLASGTLVSVLDEAVTHSGSFRILWPSSRHLSPKLRVFVDFMGDTLFPH